MRFIVPNSFWASEGNTFDILTRYCKGDITEKISNDYVIPAKYKRGKLIAEEVVHKGKPYFEVDISGDELIGMSKDFDVMITNGSVYFDLKGKRFHCR